MSQARFFLRHLSLLLALGATALVLMLTWVGPALINPAEEMDVLGPQRHFVWDINSDRLQTYTWDYDIKIEGDPTHVAVFPNLPFRIDLDRGENPGTSTFRLEIRVHINGMEAYLSGNSVSVDERSGPGGYSYDVPRGNPLSHEDVDQSFLREGTNHVKVTAKSTLDIETEGTETFDVSLGPVRTYRYQADSDKDGVVDNFQWVPFHTAFLAVPASILAAWGGAKGGKKWQERLCGEEK